MYPDFTLEGTALYLRRTLNQAQLDLIVRISRAILIIITLLVAGRLVWYSGTHLLAPPASLQALEDQVKILSLMEPPAPEDKIGKEEFAALRSSTVFGEPPAAENQDPTPEEPTAPITPLNLELIGTFITSPDDAQAIIEDGKTKVQEVFSLREKVFGEAILTKIDSNRVEVIYNGKTEILTIDETGGEGGATSDPNAEEFIVDEKELNEALDNLPLLLTQARAVPYFKEGQAVGLRLFAIRTGSLYDKIGLQNGDILKSINGKSLADISQAMKLFEQLREERSLNVELERARQEKTFRYVIQ